MKIQLFTSFKVVSLTNFRSKSVKISSLLTRSCTPGKYSIRMSSTSGFSDIRVASWNVNGIRALYRHDPSGDAIRRVFDKYRPDVLCLQETKIQKAHVDEVRDTFFKIHEDLRPADSFWSCSTARKGYSGTAMIIFGDKLAGQEYSVEYGIGEAEADLEGRSITLCHEAFSLVNVYVPNAGAALKRLAYRTDTWDAALASHMASLQARRPGSRTILTGDMNVAHRAIDYYNPDNKATQRQAGTTPQEQESFETKFLSSGLLIDTYRQQNPTDNGYSFYSARKGEGGRQRREGLRIDYVLTDDYGAHARESGHEAWVEESVLHPFSDHCPVGATVPL